MSSNNSGNHESLVPKYGYVPVIAGGIIILVFAVIISRENYLLFHGITETFSIVIAFTIFVIAWNVRRLLDNQYILFIGIAYLFVGVLDLIHLLSYKGMGVFPGNDANLSTQLWIVSRYLASVSLLVAPFFIRRRFYAGIVFWCYFVVTALIFISLFYWHNFPVAYIEGSGLTPFKVISEYVISFVLFCAILILLKFRNAFGRGVVQYLIVAMAANITSEMAFTLYVDVYGIANVIGHLLAVISFYFIYKALIETGLSKPYNLLFRNLKESEVKLAQHAAELETSNKELEAFCYSVSHDLRAPLRSMDGYSQLLLEDYKDKLDEQGKRYIANIQESSAEMSQLIDDLLKLSRITRADMNRENIDISDLVSRIFKKLMKNKLDRTVAINITPGLQTYGDNNLLTVMLENLIDNAIKYTAGADNAQISFGVLRNETPVYYLRDNGAGFDMKYVDKLFKPFQRLHDEKQFPGNGIGLAIVQRVISRHGGKVWAEGEVGKGAAFYFTLGREYDIDPVSISPTL